MKNWLASKGRFSNLSGLSMSINHIRGLVILEYMRVGLIPYFPGKKTESLEALLHGQTGTKSKRKFRKIWKKAQKRYLNRSSIIYGSSSYGYPSKKPTGYQMMQRKKLVYRYIKSKIINDM